MRKNYDSLYFADEKPHTYPGAKINIQAAEYKAPDPNHHVPYCLYRVVEQAICIVTILGPYFTLAHYIQYLQRACFPTGVKFLKTLEHIFRIFSLPLQHSAWGRE